MTELWLALLNLVPFYTVPGITKWHCKRNRFAYLMHIKETGVAIISALDNMTWDARLKHQRLG
jgi:hypothetical protein